MLFNALYKIVDLTGLVVLIGKIGRKNRTIQGLFCLSVQWDKGAAKQRVCQGCWNTGMPIS
jgi:hypothetical protein